MATTLGVGIMIGRRNISFNSLLLAAIIILIADPDSLFQPGFQLSFCAVAAILLIVPLIPLGREITGIVRYIISVAVVTIAATLGTGIISAYHFHTFPIYFVIANIPVLALLPFLMGGGVIIMVLEALGYDPVILCEMVNDLFNVIFKITSWVASLPHATIDRLYFPWWISLPYFAALGTSIFFLAKPSIKRAISPTLLCAITVIMFLMVNEDCDGEDFFITRSSTETSAIYRNGNQAFLITTALGRKAEAVAESYRRNFSNYLDSHKVDTLIIANDSIMYRGLKRVGQEVTVNNKVYHFIANNEISELNVRVNYAVVCRGFSGDVMTIVRNLEPDTVLLSYDLHPRRHKRYADSLTSNKTPYRSLKISQ
jgi:competence protein ComEC